MASWIPLIGPGVGGVAITSRLESNNELKFTFS